MSKPFKYDAFLSHNANDKARVRDLARRLQQAGVRVWFDEWNIRSGDIIALKVDEGLEDSRVLLLCVSSDALASGWIAMERSTAIHRDPSNDDRRFIPLLLDDCQLPDTLRRYKYLDFRTGSDAAFLEVLAACQPESSSRPPEAGVTPTMIQQLAKKARREAPESPASIGFRLVGSPAPHRKVITRLSWAPDGNRLASAGQDGVIQLSTMGGGVAFQRIAVPWSLSGMLTDPGAAWSPAWSADGSSIACGYTDGVIRIWNSETGELVNSLEGHDIKVNNVAWSPDGRTLASSADDCLIKLWGASSTDNLATLAGHRLGVNTIAWHPRGDLLASASLDNTVRVWDTTTRKQLRILEGHNDIVITVIWSPDGSLLLSSSADETIRIWDATTGAPLRVLEGHRGPVSCIAFSYDGQLLASKGIAPDSTVRIWRAGSWELLASLSERSTQMWFAGIAFHPSRMQLATLCESDRRVRIWELDSERLLRAASAPNAVRYCSAKVVLLGEGTVGKTSLAHRLIDDAYVVCDRTHGMRVWRLELPDTKDETLDREVMLWDLAGQEDYRLIHQLFLEQTALALLLINPQKDDPFAEAGDWLKALKRATGGREATLGTSRLLILSQVDAGGPKLSNAKLTEFCEQYDFAGWLTTSAKTGSNCSDRANGGKPSTLKQLIAKSIRWDQLPSTSTPRLLAALKKAVVAMRDEHDIDLLRFGEVTQRLEQILPAESLGETVVRTTITLLANHGLVRPLKFGDLILLRPELLNGYAAAIIRAARVHTDEIGSVLEAEVYHPGFDFTGVERLRHRSDEELLLRAIVQTFLDCSLCFAEDTPKGRHLVFPSQYRRGKETDKSPEIFASYRFSGEWQTVWTTLIVRLWSSQEFEHRELWQNAAEFASSKGHILGLKLDRTQGDGTARISVYFDEEVPDELRAIFMEYVHRHLVRFGCEVRRDRRYVCQNPACGAPVTNLDTVRRRLDAHMTFITCQECDEKISLIDDIERQQTSEPVGRKIVAMDQLATQKLDNQALEQILIGHMMAICGEANQVFRELTKFDYGIDGEVEFKDNDGHASGKKIYVQLKSGNSYLRRRKHDGQEVFDLKDDRHLDYWINQPVDVYLVVRQHDHNSRVETIRWMNVTAYLRARADKPSRQIVFSGEKLNTGALWRVRDSFFPPSSTAVAAAK